MLKYIYHDCGNKTFKYFQNDKIDYLMKLIGRKYKLYVEVSEGNYIYKMKEIRKLICQNTKRYTNEKNISQRQLSFLVRPRKGRVSRFAPLYIAAIYDLLYKDQYADICTWLSNKTLNGDNSPTEYDYTTYLLSEYTLFVNQVFLLRSENRAERYEYEEPTSAEPEIAYYHKQCQKLRNTLPEPIIQIFRLKKRNVWEDISHS